jgi:hypothetical protein
MITWNQRRGVKKNITTARGKRIEVRDGGSSLHNLSRETTTSGTFLSGRREALHDPIKHDESPLEDQRHLN